MIEGRPRESLVQYENPIEVTHLILQLNNRYQQGKMLKTPLKRVSAVSIFCIDYY